MRRLALALCALLLVVPATDAQVITENKTQLGIFGSGFIGDNANAVTGLTLTRYLTPKIEVGGTTFLTFFDAGDGVDVSGFVGGLFAYNFVGQSFTIPFLFAEGGTTVGDFSAAFVGGGGGIKHFVNEDVALQGRVSTQWQSVGGSFQWIEGVNFDVGISLYLGG